MTFYGQTFTGCGKPFAVESADSELVHLSSVFVKPVGDNSCKYWDFKIANEAGRFFTVARLTKDKPTASIDYFLTTGTLVQLCTDNASHSGEKTTFDVAGYVEPMGGMSDSADEEDEEVSEAEAEADIQTATDKALSGLAAKAAAAAAAPAEADSSDEGEEDTDDEPETAPTAGADDDDSNAEEDGEEENSDSDDSDSGSEEEVEEPKPAPVVVKSVKGTKGKAVVDSKKRKATEPASEQPATKKSTSGPAADFEKAVIAHLKSTGGISKIPLIGSKVKKPEGLKMKLGAFLKERPQLFSVNGDSVTLKK